MVAQETYVERRFEFTMNTIMILTTLFVLDENDCWIEWILYILKLDSKTYLLIVDWALYREIASNG